MPPPILQMGFYIHQYILYSMHSIAVVLTTIRKPECSKPYLMFYALIFWPPSESCVPCFHQVEVTKFGIDKKNMFAFWDVSKNDN